MPVHLDTTFCIDLIREARRGVAGRATAKLSQLADTALFASVFVVCELQAGARLSHNPRTELRRVGRLVNELEVVFPDETFPVSYGEAEAHLRRHGTPIPTMDLLIGVLARSHGRPLLTRDHEHYRKIPDLVVETY